MKLSRHEDTRFQLERVRLPLVAFIDVVLFLLMYFIFAGSLSDEESQLAASLKTDKPSQSTSDLAPLVLHVEPVGPAFRFRLGERSAGDQASLVSILKQLPKRDGIIVRVRGEVPVDAAAIALQAASDAGFDKVSYVPGR